MWRKLACGCINDGTVKKNFLVFFCKRENCGEKKGCAALQGYVLGLYVFGRDADPVWGRKPDPDATVKKTFFYFKSLMIKLCFNIEKSEICFFIFLNQ